MKHRKHILALLVVCLSGVWPGFGQAPTAQVVPDGSVLAEGEFCYTITAGNTGTSGKPGAEQAIGLVFQNTQRKQVDGADTLTIVVHQHMSNGKFDMCDSLLLRRSDLRPIRLDTDRDGAPHVHLDYSDNRVTGWKMVKSAKQPIDIAFDGPVWDGNLWDTTFAALPLRAATIGYPPASTTAARVTFW